MVELGFKHHDVKCAPFVELLIGTRCAPAALRTRSEATVAVRGSEVDRVKGIARLGPVAGGIHDGALGRSLLP
jgi:hypothetical protein